MAWTQPGRPTLAGRGVEGRRKEGAPLLPPAGESPCAFLLGSASAHLLPWPPCLSLFPHGPNYLSFKPPRGNPSAERAALISQTGSGPQHSDLSR